MSTALVIPILARWMHILAAVVAVGGTFFAWCALAPSARETLDDESQRRLWSAIRTCWQRITHTCILFFLASGFYNYLLITRFNHRGQPLYHALFGIKFLIALPVFALAIALTSQRPWANPIQSRSRTWTGVLVVLAVAVVLVSGVMKNIPPPLQ
ncbi:MAG: hypothetical protein GY851_20555 [bacterium]|nr:hypothetical protein [bacterium]